MTGFTAVVAVLGSDELMHERRVQLQCDSNGVVFLALNCLIYGFSQ